MIKEKWFKKFVKLINKESQDYMTDEVHKSLIRSGIQDTLYLMGVSIDEKKYSFANGFALFLKEMGITKIEA